jgi:chloramphenicol-sensitive protein RarD
MNPGIVFAVLAYICWGLIPIYFKALKSIPADEILLYRMIWALVFLFGILTIKHHWRWLGLAVRSRPLLLRSALGAIVLSLNWFVYIWAVNSGHVVEASLGYFINPLVNVLVAWVVLHERLRPAQWGAIALAAAGVLWLTWQAGQLPWISLILACSFSCYGLLRKTSSLGALEGLTLETAILFPFAITILLALSIHQNHNSFVAADTHLRWLLVASGPVTAIPLLLFAAGARRISFSMLGILQYIGPTLQLLVGVQLYHEPFTATKLIGYTAIWAALGLYSAEGLWRTRRQVAPA